MFPTGSMPSETGDGVTVKYPPAAVTESGTVKVGCAGSSVVTTTEPESAAPDACDASTLAALTVMVMLWPAPTVPVCGVAVKPAPLTVLVNVTLPPPRLLTVSCCVAGAAPPQLALPKSIVAGDTPATGGVVTTLFDELPQPSAASAAPRSQDRFIALSRSVEIDRSTAAQRSHVEHAAVKRGRAPLRQIAARSKRR